MLRAVRGTAVPTHSTRSYGDTLPYPESSAPSSHASSPPPPPPPERAAPPRGEITEQLLRLAVHGPADDLAPHEIAQQLLREAKEAAARAASPAPPTPPPPPPPLPPVTPATRVHAAGGAGSARADPGAPAGTAAPAHTAAFFRLGGAVVFALCLVICLAVGYARPRLLARNRPTATPTPTAGSRSKSANGRGGVASPGRKEKAQREARAPEDDHQQRDGLLSACDDDHEAVSGVGLALESFLRPVGRRLV